MKLKMAYCFLLNVLVYSTVLAQPQQQQQQQDITPVSPEAAALAKMVNYPVNLNTGVPDISIPLYKIESGGMVLPITLQYHAAGFQLNEHSTRTGLGWSLSCDLQITRSINGRDDLITGGYALNTSIKCHCPDNPNTNYPLGPSNWQDVYNLTLGEWDGMPDKFNYKLLNKAGSFYFGKDQNGYTKIVPVPYEKIQIEYANQEFTITDNDGTKYVFGSAGARETTDLLVTSWKCTSVSNATNTETISFAYDEKTPENFFSRVESIEYYNNSNPDCGDGYFTSQFVSYTDSWITKYDPLVNKYPFYKLSSPKYMEHIAGKPSVFHLPYVRYENGTPVVEDHAYPTDAVNSATLRTVNGLVISSIQFNGGKVDFTGIDKLSSIKVKHPDGSLLRTFNFYHTESGGYQGNFKPTLYLGAVHVVNSDGQLKERYLLLYKNTYPFGDGMVGKDAWGYANAFTTNFEQYTGPILPHQEIKQGFYESCTSLYNNITFSFGNTLETEVPDRENSQRGILRRIVYPTGGYVNFDFESNKYKEGGAGTSFCVQMGGGLRIRAITYYDGKSMQPVSQKYYRYGDLEDGIGMVVNTPPKVFNGNTLKYDGYSYSTQVAYVKALGSSEFPCNTKSCVQIVARETKTTYLPASADNYTFPNGAQIYYTRVTEYNSDLGKETGKTVHTFYQPYEFTYVYPRKIAGTNIDYLRPDGLMGRQKSIEDYKYQNGRYQLVHSKGFEYSKYSQPEKVKVIYAFNGAEIRMVGGGVGSMPDLYNPNVPFASGNSVPGFTAGQYGIEVATLLLDKETEKFITDAGSYTQQTRYYYNTTYLQPYAVESQKSDGSIITRNLKYSYDFADNTVYAQMLAKNMISQLIQEQVTGTGGTLSTTRTNYNIFPGNLIAPASVQKSYGNGSFTTEMQYDLYDDKANLLQSTAKDGIVTSYIWGYQQKYILAKIAGLPYAQATAGIDVAGLQTVTAENQLSNVFSNVRTSNPNALVTSFTHKLLTGVSSNTDPSGITRFFEYDAAGRLSVVKNNNGHILQTYTYKMTGETSEMAMDAHTAITGDMESCNIPGPGNTKMVYNYTVPGGVRYSNGTNVHYPYVIYENTIQNYQPTDKDGMTEADVPIELYSWFDLTRPVPVSCYLDLWKDGQLVYSKRFNYNYTNHWIPTTLYIPRGEYLVNFRVDDNFDNFIYTNNFYSAATPNIPENDFLLNQPVTINFAPGTTYTITSRNY